MNARISSSWAPLPPTKTKTKTKEGPLLPGLWFFSPSIRTSCRKVFFTPSLLHFLIYFFSVPREVPFCRLSNVQIEMPLSVAFFISAFVSNIFISLKYMLFFYFWSKLLWMGICIVYILMVLFLEYLSL